MASRLSLEIESYRNAGGRSTGQRARPQCPANYIAPLGNTCDFCYHAASMESPLGRRDGAWESVETTPSPKYKPISIYGSPGTPSPKTPFRPSGSQSTPSLKQTGSMVIGTTIAHVPCDAWLPLREEEKHKSLRNKFSWWRNFGEGVGHNHAVGKYGHSPGYDPKLHLGGEGAFTYLQSYNGNLRLVCPTAQDVKKGGHWAM